MTIDFVRTLTTDQVLLFLLAGGMGGLLRHLLSKGGLILPSIRVINKERLLRLGFLSSLVIGAAGGILVDHHWLTAFFSGYAGPHALEKILTRGVLNGHLKARK